MTKRSERGVGDPISALLGAAVLAGFIVYGTFAGLVYVGKIMAGTAGSENYSSYEEAIQRDRQESELHKTPTEPAECRGYREHPSRGNPGREYNPAAPQRAC